MEKQNEMTVAVSEMVPVEHVKATSKLSKACTSALPVHSLPVQPALFENKRPGNSNFKFQTSLNDN